MKTEAKRTRPRNEVKAIWCFVVRERDRVRDAVNLFVSVFALLQDRQRET
jgi:hypothetical protein